MTITLTMSNVPPAEAGILIRALEPIGAALCPAGAVHTVTQEIDA